MVCTTSLRVENNEKSKPRDLKLWRLLPSLTCVIVTIQLSALLVHYLEAKTNGTRQNKEVYYILQQQMT